MNNINTDNINDQHIALNSIATEVGLAAYLKIYDNWRGYEVEVDQSYFGKQWDRIAALEEHLHRHFGCVIPEPDRWVLEGLQYVTFGMNELFRSEVSGRILYIRLLKPMSASQFNQLQKETQHDTTG